MNRMDFSILKREKKARITAAWGGFAGDLFTFS